jgi:hypothetical protein
LLTKNLDGNTTMPPSTVLMPSNTRLMLPPTESPIKVWQSMVDEQSMADSLPRMRPPFLPLNRYTQFVGRSYTHYQSLVEQQCKMFEVDYLKTGGWSRIRSDRSFESFAAGQQYAPSGPTRKCILPGPSFTHYPAFQVKIIILLSKAK